MYLGRDFAKFKFCPNPIELRKNRDPSTCLSDAKADRFARDKKLRAPHTPAEKEDSRQYRISQHLGEFMSFISGDYTQAELDELSAKRV